MARKMGNEKARVKPIANSAPAKKSFRLEFKNTAQKIAYVAFEQHDMLFLIGPAGTAKTHLSVSFAVSEILAKKRKQIILCRPIVEAGEKLGFLPGTFEEKINPYLMPIFDCLDTIVGRETADRDTVNHSIQIVPLAYMRGRSLSNKEYIPTPDGLKQMGEINVGDHVIGSDGKPTKVLNVYPQGKLPVFEIGFSDRTKSICSADHLWNTMTLNEKRHNKGFTTKKTSEIAENIKNKHNQKVHRVPLLSAPVEFTPKETLIDPYLLGVLLGDGCMTSTAVHLSSADQGILDECVKVLPEGHNIVYRGKYDYAITSQGKNNEIKANLAELGLMGKKSPRKFIPFNYKFNSANVRLAILQGLLDTDGWICKHRSGVCRIQFCSTSKMLADDVMFLVRSLGGLAYCRLREFDENDSHEYNGKLIKHVHNSYNVDIMMPVNPFRLQRKANQYGNNQKFTKMISSITSIGEEECTCIQVEAKDHLYLTNDFIVTHNTFHDSIVILDEAQNATDEQLKLAISRLGLNSKMIITGDATQSDLKGDVALPRVVEAMKSVQGISVVEFNESHIVRHALVADILRAWPAK